MASNCSRVTKKVINLKKDQTFTLLEHINLYLNMSALNIIETHFKIRQTDYAVISMGEKKPSQSSIPLAGSLLGFPLLLFPPFFSQQRKSVHKVTTISQHHLSSEYSSPFPVLPVLNSFSRTQTAHANIGIERCRRSSAGFHFSTARSGFSSLTVYHTHRA